MAERKPKVGDAAMVDGVELTVTAVEPRGKPVVKFGDKVALACAGLVATARKRHSKPIADNEAAIKEAMKIEGRNDRKLAVLQLAAEGDKLHDALVEELGGIPGGYKVSTNLRSVQWVAAGNCWTVRGRLLSYEDRQRERGRAV